eukprot:Em0024g49a
MMQSYQWKHKTADQLLQRFYWLTLQKDVADYCRRCAICQKPFPVKPHSAPLIPLLIVDEPFQKVAMDIVGPYPEVAREIRIFVLCDYATQYPEAVPMKSVDAESVAEEMRGTGPLDATKETWVVKSKSSDSVKSHILAMRDQIDLMTKLVHDSLEEAQMKQKIWLPPYRIPQAYLGTVKQEIQKMRNYHSIQQRVEGHFVPSKEDGSLRLCIDFSRLNRVSESEAYPMLRVDDLINLLGKIKYVSTGYVDRSPSITPSI